MAGSHEFPGLQMPDSPVWERARATTMRGDDMEVLDLAMAFGSLLRGHLAVREALEPWLSSGDDIRAASAVPAPGLGDLHTHRLRERATRALCEWAAASWHRRSSAGELSSVVLHTGSEAVETALKTALLATGRERIVAFEGGYHGTFGLALAATHGARFREPFAEQFSHAVRFAAWDSVPALDATIACVIVEPVQGRAGVLLPAPDFLERLRRACDDAGALLVLDDVLAGCGRLGADTLPGADVDPDLVCLGKALGSGIPASAVIARREVAAAAWGSITGEAIHTSTMLGEPLACAGILNTLARLDTDRLRDASTAWERALLPVAERSALAVRGRGLLWAIDTGTESGGAELADALLRHERILVVPSAPDASCITLYPSLAHTADDAQRVAAAITRRAR